jgi:hypothetical protein
VYSKSECTIESVSVPVRPALNTITLQRIIWLWWNFSTQNCLINISVEFKDDNDSPKICRVIAKSLIIFYPFLYKHWPIPIVTNPLSIIIKITTTTIIYHSIENFTGCKMLYKTLREKFPSKFWETDDGFEFSTPDYLRLNFLKYMQYSDLNSRFPPSFFFLFLCWKKPVLLVSFSF